MICMSCSGLKLEEVAVCVTLSIHVNAQGVVHLMQHPLGQHRHIECMLRICRSWIIILGRVDDFSATPNPLLWMSRVGSHHTVITLVDAG
jgi:hypothetical protein